ncbi:MAG: ClpXP protease specificity-enhancing factor SspB [Hydrogenophilus sp.]|nr:ClpXP protease specificity-enhancing factor SspB [Hydrogenophilus sp.]
MLALSTKCYLVQAIWQWCVDRGLTPYLSAAVAGSQVPKGYDQEGTIVLNLSPEAVRDLTFTSEGIGCRTRFSGQVYEVWIPAENVLAIYSKESGHGIALPNEMFAAPEPEGGEGASPDEFHKAHPPVKKGGFKRLK